MNRKTTIGSLFLFLLSGLLPAAAQNLKQDSALDAMPAALGKDLDQYRSQRLQEKLFVHTDKESYLAGEICWFKLYVVEAGFHRPLDLSKLAFLEWLDKDNKPVLQTKVGLGKGHGDGSLYLPLTLSTGNYKLRAYTSWMRNYGAEGFFEKSISVVNARKSAGTPFAPAPLKYSVAFFPEGGNLVENFSSKIGFKITDQYGRGIECSGVITEDDQDTVARFRPLRFGIGNVVLTPRPGHHYRSTVRLEDGTAISTLLPAAYKEGVVMSVSDEEKDRVRVNVQSTASESSIYLIAQNRQSVRMAQTIFLKQGKANFLLNKSSLGEGINQLTLFNAARQPICERLIFIPPASALHLELTADRQHYATRKKIILQISARSGKDTAVSADCSLSVFRVDSLRPLPAGHIMEYLWLVSELKGKIESPEYYFDHQEDGQAADNLMITQGWRRFRWEEVVRRAVPSFDYAPDYHGAIITGKIVDSRTGASATRRVQAYLSVPGTRTQFTSAYCDDAGADKIRIKGFLWCPANDCTNGSSGGQPVQSGHCQSIFRNVHGYPIGSLRPAFL